LGKKLERVSVKSRVGSLEFQMCCSTSPAMTEVLTIAVQRRSAGGTNYVFPDVCARQRSRVYSAIYKSELNSFSYQREQSKPQRFPEGNQGRGTGGFLPSEFWLCGVRKRDAHSRYGPTPALPPWLRVSFLQTLSQEGRMVLWLRIRTVSQKSLFMKKNIFLLSFVSGRL